MSKSTNPTESAAATEGIDHAALGGEPIDLGDAARADEPNIENPAEFFAGYDARLVKAAADGYDGTELEEFAERLRNEALNLAVEQEAPQAVLDAIHAHFSDLDEILTGVPHAIEVDPEVGAANAALAEALGVGEPVDAARVEYADGTAPEIGDDGLQLLAEAVEVVGTPTPTALAGLPNGTAVDASQRISGDIAAHIAVQHEAEGALTRFDLLRVEFGAVAAAEESADLVAHLERLIEMSRAWVAAIELEQAQESAA
ncbi:hypothetical protein [Agromyces sp. NPDC058104]|uniref:hypothetical protein n=1 Tax=Agromyces sp. NPDC058104 TaxID=3346342 RepID=UPI0036DBB469